MKQSAGILLYKRSNNSLLFLLAHPGGPFWKNKDSGSWSIPKGEFTDDEDPLDAARREFTEEIGTVLNGNFLELTPVKQKSGKTIYAWAAEGDLDPEKIISNIFEMEWPPKSGKMQSFPEIDRAGWFPEAEALQKINPAQADFIRQIKEILL
ncbi:MAG TPA: NUDIX domain-containing protein [Flavobacterium sp.]|jgi:predicted NUDIX family NTP pyrophosphohydrolase